ncbi:hypothetical protein [Arthrobacter globiformis]|uniref:hypothetical protein n=1 Tax=Arthrobacter globiformis TaxID=1665 RepID=UPI0027D85903|nr:hypothetical protein [Arthrobacter globiformis]
MERARDVSPDTVLNIDEWLEVAASIAGELAVAAPADAPVLADTAAAGWELQLDQQLANAPELVPQRTIRRARDRIRAVGQDVTRPLIHGDLHEKNVRQPLAVPGL